MELAVEVQSGHNAVGDQFQNAQSNAELEKRKSSKRLREFLPCSEASWSLEGFLDAAGIQIARQSTRTLDRTSPTARLARVDYQQMCEIERNVLDRNRRLVSTVGENMIFVLGRSKKIDRVEGNPEQR